MIISLLNEDTNIICTEDTRKELVNEDITSNILVVEPNKHYKLGNLQFDTIRAYNPNKRFHPLKNNWVGYIIEANGYKYCHLGDSDFIDEYNNLECDVLFVPIGGTYTMDYRDGSVATNLIKPKIVVPIHFNTLHGLEVDVNEFYSLINKDILHN